MILSSNKLPSIAVCACLLITVPLFSAAFYTLSFLCHTSQLHEFSLYHLGSLEAANLPPYSCVEEGDAAQTLASLQSVLFKSKGSGKPTSSREEGEEEPMLVVAMEMKLDKPRNSKVNQTD